MSEINVVPYIDVMLVLLVIFMITAPLLKTGVEVELPRATSEPLNNQEQQPLVLTVDDGGKYYLNVGEDPEAALDENALVALAAAVIRRQPDKAVLVRGDANVDYGRVVRAMTLLQGAGVPQVGLITEQPQ
jgi:biopolymer transport protein TolR